LEEEQNIKTFCASIIVIRRKRDCICNIKKEGGEVVKDRKIVREKII